MKSVTCTPLSITLISFFGHGISAVEEYSRFLSPEETSSYRKSGFDSTINYSNGCSLDNAGRAVFPQDILKRFDSFVDSSELKSSFKSRDDMSTSAIVTTREISKTTKRHQDHFSGVGGFVAPLDNDKLVPSSSVGSVVEGDVGIIFLNSNEDANFIHGNTSIDITEGKLVTFRGDVDHNTVINDGIVQMVGPFHLDTFQLVGECNPTTCTSGTPDGTPCGTNVGSGESCVCAFEVGAPPGHPPNCVEAPPPPPPPAPSPTDGCFPGDALVKVLGKKDSVMMKDVNVGDKIMSSSSSEYSEVFAFGYHKENEIMEYLKIDLTTEEESVDDTNDDDDDDVILSSLEVSHNHMVYVGKNMKPKLANQVQVGDLLPNKDGVFLKIRSIESVKKEGVYHPFTVDGSIIVNDIQALTYSIEGVVPFISIGGYSFMNMHHFQHMMYGPLRLLCQVSPESYCHLKNSRDDDGTHHWDNVIDHVMSFVMIQSHHHHELREESVLDLSSSSVVMVGVKTILCLCLFVVYMMESLFSSVTNIMLVVLLAFLSQVMFWFVFFAAGKKSKLCGEDTEKKLYD